MENMRNIEPLNKNIEQEENRSFSSQQVQNQAKSVYPSDARIMREIQLDIIKSNNLLKKISNRLGYIVFILLIPYIVPLIFYIFIISLGLSLKLPSL